MQALIVALSLLVSLLVSQPAGACPDCQTGRDARRAVLGDDFGEHILVASAPFAVIGVICFFIERRELARRAPESLERKSRPRISRRTGPHG